MNILKNKAIKLSFVSEYRQELMGLAIISVLIVHWLLLGNVAQNSGFVKLLLVIVRNSIYTQGFLFLSGFGLYFSYLKTPIYSCYIRKRIKRFYVPIMLMIIPFFFLFDILQAYDPKAFLLHISTMEYWLNSNYFGMWYVAVQNLLYLIFPFVYYLFSKKDTLQHYLRVSIILHFIILSVNILVLVLYPDYYKAHTHFFEKVICFIQGIMCAYLVGNKHEVSIVNLLAYQILCVVGFMITLNLNLVLTVITPIVVLLYSYISHYISNTPFKKICALLSWLGRYTLEIYILHLMLYCLFMGLNFWCINDVLCISVAIIISLLLCKPVKIINTRLSDKLIK